MSGNGQTAVPPGFRFHPTDEELLYYYLRKKVAYETIDLDVITEVDLNKLEPWDLKDKCRTGSCSQNEWYFFSKRDKKYPTGMRTNRATAAGFWKATGRDKRIYDNSSKLIGMRKTLVFYTGRAPHGQKTDWIMHEYRLQDEGFQFQGYRWVVCRVFLKKTHVEQAGGGGLMRRGGVDTLQSFNKPQTDMGFYGQMYIPHILSQEETDVSSTFITPTTTTCFNNIDFECSQNLLKLTHSGIPGELTNWSLLDKIVISHHNSHTSGQVATPSSSLLQFPIHY